MENTKNKKTGKIVVLSILSVIAVIAIVALLVFGNLIGTVLNLKKEDENGLYSVNYTENYKLDELLQQGGVKNETELVEYILKVMLKGLPIKVPYEVPELGCSTFCASQTGGGYIFGRNFDNPATDCCVVKTSPKNGYRSVSVVSLSYLGYSQDNTPDSLFNRIRILATPYFPLDGVNEKGLAVGVLQLFAEPTNQNTDKPDVDTTLAIRVLLDKASSVSEAVELLESFDMHASANGCYHLHIADADGNSVVVSYVDDEMVVTEKTEDYQIATNFFVHDVDFEYKKHGEDRFAIIAQELEKVKTGVTVNEAMEVLRKAAQTDTVFEDGTLCTTQWSCVYNLQNPGLTIVNDMDYENFYTFNLE